MPCVAKRIVWFLFFRSNVARRISGAAFLRLEIEDAR